MAAPYQNIFGYGGTQVDQGAGLFGVDPEMQKLIDQGIITQTSRDYINEGGPGNLTMNNVDWTRLPALGPPGADKMGLNWVTAAHGGLVDPSRVYNDPNYGPVTYSQNLKSQQRDWMDMIGPIYAAILTAGVGALPAFGAAGAAGAGAGAGAWGGAAVADAGLSAGFYGASVASTPWYVSAGLNTAKAIGPMLGAEGGAATAQKSTPASVPTYPGTSLPMTFTASNFGNASGTPPTVPDGSAPVATGIAPNAYENSYGFNQVVI